MRPVERQVHLEIESRLENIELVQAVVEESLRQLDLDHDAAYWIGMSVREAVANAIQHGNCLDPGKQVQIDFGVQNGEVVIRVEDQGKGFDLQSLPDPLDPENLLKPDGRGIFYMKSFMDDIDYSFRPEGGTVVTLRKRIRVGAPGGKTRQEEQEG